MNLPKYPVYPYRLDETRASIGFHGRGYCITYPVPAESYKNAYQYNHKA